MTDQPTQSQQPSEQSAKHGPLHDEALEHETRGLVQAGRPTRAEEWRDPEPAGEDQPVGDVGIVPEDRRGTPAGMTQQDVETRTTIAQALGKEVWPADRDTLLGRAADASAPDGVLDLLRSLPEGEEFTNVQDVVRALGLHVETQRF